MELNRRKVLKDVMPAVGIASVSGMAVKEPAQASGLTDDFEKTVKLAREGSRSLTQGDARAMKEVFSRAGDVMIMGGWGGYERGWDQVGPRLEWAAGRFAESRNYSCERLAAGERGDLAYECFLERIDARLVGADSFHEIALRVTQVYRREQGGWRIVLRHADFLTPKAG